MPHEIEHETTEIWKTPGLFIENRLYFVPVDSAQPQNYEEGSFTTCPDKKLRQSEIKPEVVLKMIDFRCSAYRISCARG